MESKERELFNISDTLIELKEYKSAKLILQKISTQNLSINDEVLYRLALIEAQLFGNEVAHKYILDNKNSFYNQESYYNALRKTGFKFYCPVKRIFIDKFYPLPEFYFKKLKEYKSDLNLEDFETLNIKEYLCNESGSNDRDRLYALFINNLVKETQIGLKSKVLDFSPSKPFEQFMRWNNTFEYTTADGLLDNYDIKTDIQNMENISSKTYDGVICSHVLEHVQDDVKSMKEIYRVLRPGGWAILMAPINLKKIEIDEDFTVIDIAERWRRFGQDDHLRVYSKKGFTDRISESGFKLLELSKDYFGAFEMQKCGISTSSVLYIGIK